MKTTILVSHHLDLQDDALPAPYLEVCNQDNERRPSGFDVYDSDFKDNISNKNKLYCELSPLYSFWKQGLITDTFGLAHYRRVFCLESIEQPVETLKIPFDQRYKTAMDQVQSLDLYKNKIVVGNAFLGGMNIWEQFYDAHPHLFPFFEYACERFGEIYPDLGNPSHFFNNCPYLSPCNMFIAPKCIVQKWCEIIFKFLFSIEDAAPAELDTYSSRWAGFFSERFFTYFVSSLHNDIEVVIKPIILFE